MNRINTLLITVVLILFVSGCALIEAQVAHIHPVKENSKIVKSACIKDHIELKLINSYNEVFDLEDVIVNYGKTEFDPLDEKLKRFIVSTDEEFNKANIQYSKNGIEESFLGTKYATYTDEALLAILANLYSMKVAVYDKKTDKLYDIDYKVSEINLSKELRHNIYNGFIDTAKYYDDRAKDK